MGEMNLSEMLARVLQGFVPFLFALCFHEYAHGWMARRKGDRSAEIMGRLTLNPFAHADILGTFVLPILALAFRLPLFGWAKPVPVDERNLKDPRRDLFWIALAGPLSNLLLAFLTTLVMAFLVRFQPQTANDSGVADILQVFLVLNLLLACFNLIPLHPLDGGKVLARFLPTDANRWLEENQGTTNMMLLVLMFSGAFSYLAVPVQWLARVLYTVSGYLAGVI